MALGFWLLVSGFWLVAFGLEYLVFVFWFMGWLLAFGLLFLVFGFCMLDLDIWFGAFGFELLGALQSVFLGRIPKRDDPPTPSFKLYSLRHGF